MKSRLRQDKPLNPRQELFCSRYLIGFNGTVAYHQTYDQATYTSCRKAASALLCDARIYRQITQLARQVFEAWERRRGLALDEYRGALRPTR
jgi:hypothetical protein